MAYIVQTDLESRFGAERVAQIFQIQNSDGTTTGNADGPSLTATIADAGAELEELLGVVYVVPFAQVGGAYDQAIMEIVSVFTMYRGSLLRRPEYTTEGRVAASPYAQAYRQALARCQEIKEGKRRLTNQALKPANVGGQLVNSNPSDVNPYFYFLPNPVDGTGGMDPY